MSARAAEVRGSKARPRRTELKVVARRKGGRSRSRRLSLGASTAIVAGAIVFGVLLEQVVLAQSAFKLTAIRQELAAQEARHEELLLEAAKLDSAARIEKYARTTLGMVDPTPATVRYIVADIGGQAIRNGSRLAQNVGSPVGQGTSAAGVFQEAAP